MEYDKEKYSEHVVFVDQPTFKIIQPHIRRVTCCDIVNNS